MDKEKLLNYAKNTRKFCFKVIDKGIIDDSFVPFSGIKQSKKMNDAVTKAMGFSDWFKGVNNFNITSDELFNKVIAIEDKTEREYAVSRIFKTRVSYTDEWYLDLLGCKHNPNLKDHKWDNIINGIEFDLKTTYPKINGSYSTVKGILDNPNGYIENMYTKGSSINAKDPSERGHTDSINNRLFIVSNSDFAYLNRFMVECGYIKRWEALEYLAKNLSEEYIFYNVVQNNNDYKFYSIKSSIMIINEVSENKIDYKLVKCEYNK